VREFGSNRSDRDSPNEFTYMCGKLSLHFEMAESNDLFTGKRENK